MGFLKSVFKGRDEPIRSYSDFWNWFKENEKQFFTIVKSRTNIESGFFDPLSRKLDELKEGYFYLVGIFDDHTVELIVTADGDVKNIVFVEEFVSAAPNIPSWKITALKQPVDVKKVGIEMNGLIFDENTLSFYANEAADYPDLIDITIVHSNLTSENRSLILKGANIFLENCLGELSFVSNIDNIDVSGFNEAEKDLIPIVKLKEFLDWKYREFVEKYEQVHYDLNSGIWSTFETNLEGGGVLISVLNTNLLNWDSKASLPWISIFTINYDGTRNNGMPDEKIEKVLAGMEGQIVQKLSAVNGCLYLGRQTGDNRRDIYFVCGDFRQPAKIFYEAKSNFGKDFEIGFDIYKDKYWQTFERFEGV